MHNITIIKTAFTHMLLQGRKLCCPFFALTIMLSGIAQISFADVLLDVDGARDKNIRPQIKQQEFKTARIDDENFEFLVYAGAYKFEGFDSRALAGIKAAYHFENKFFMEIDYGSSSVKGRIDPLDANTAIDENITIYDLGLAYNLLEGQGFRANGKAINSNFFIKYAIGKVNVDSVKNDSKSIGLGLRLLLPKDRFSIQIGANKDTVESSNNLKFFTGLGIYF
jgi:hypothetical protein